MAAKSCSQLDIMEQLVYTAVQEESHGKCGGYKRELITQNLSMLEESLVACSLCTGIMHNACSIKGGLAQVCESCVGEDMTSQPVGPIRAIVAQLGCRCPLLDRECEWIGTVGGVVEHMGECNQFVVQCPYVKYGCKRQMKRGELETHRKDAKEYHTEVVSVFMADKVEKLEEEKKQQTVVIQKLESALNEFIQIKDYLKLNGIVWTIGNRHEVINKIYKIRGQPQKAVVVQENPNNAIFSQWNGTNLNGPSFLIHSFYHLYPMLTIQYDPYATLSITSMNIGQCTQYVQWPLSGKSKIVLVNQENPEDSWVYENDDFQIPHANGGNFPIPINIPFDILLDDKYNRDGTFVFKIFINPKCQALQLPLGNELTKRPRKSKSMNVDNSDSY